MKEFLPFYMTALFLTVGYIFYVFMTKGDGVAFAAFVGALMFCVGKMYEKRKYKKGL